MDRKMTLRRLFRSLTSVSDAGSSGGCMHALHGIAAACPCLPACCWLRGCLLVWQHHGSIDASP